MSMKNLLIIPNLFLDEDDKNTSRLSTSIAANETFYAHPLSGMYTHATIFIKQTPATANGADEVDFNIQTSYDGGATWHALKNFHYVNGDDGAEQSQFCHIHFPVAAVNATAISTTASDDSGVNHPLGTHLRVSLVLTAGAAPATNIATGYAILRG